jgi:toxin secretion/phage lysis holin
LNHVPVAADWLEGNTLAMLRALFVLMAADILGGLVVAFVKKQVSSTVSWRGMGKKVMTFLVVLVVAVLQSVAKLPPVVFFGFTFTMLDGTILFYAAWEGISVLEKAAALKVPLPKWLVESLAKLRGEQPPSITVGFRHEQPKEGN